MGKFRFKQFDVEHERSSMKVGVDAVLLGAWATKTDGRILDVGCGCGIIALMLSQNGAEVTAIDIHEDSVEEAKANFGRSRWCQRLKAINIDIFEFVKQNKTKYDLVISNPPFFNSGVREPASPREVARHGAILSPATLPAMAAELLKPAGKLEMISSMDFHNTMIEAFRKSGFVIDRLCYVADHPGKQPKRVMVSGLYYPDGCERKSPGEKTELFIRNDNQTYSEQYKELTKDYYLNL